MKHWDQWEFQDPILGYLLYWDLMVIYGDLMGFMGIYIPLHRPINGNFRIQQMEVRKRTICLAIPLMGYINK